jgi:predicted ATPase
MRASRYQALTYYPRRAPRASLPKTAPSAEAKQGEGRVVLISGEPGIGKSRIAQTVAERVGVEYTRLRYFCSPHHEDSALYPSIAQLERAAGFRRDDTAEQRLDKLEAVLGNH